MKTNKKGLSLIEILVSLIILGIIIGIVSASLVSSFNIIRQQERKARAMGVAASKMEATLARAYSDIKDDGPGIWTWNDTSWQDDTDYHWQVSVKDATREHPTRSNISIPYKDITVTSFYNEKDSLARQVAATKTVRLLNTAAYPYLHSVEFSIPHSQANSKALSGDYRNIVDTPIRFNYKVPKDVIVAYNIVLDVSIDKSDQSIAALAKTVWTRSLFDGQYSYSYLDTNDVTRSINTVISRTPIRSQPFVNNLIVYENVPAGPHEINLQWHLDPDVKDTVKLYSLEAIVLAYEGKIIRKD